MLKNCSTPTGGGGGGGRASYVTSKWIIVIYEQMININHTQDRPPGSYFLNC